MQKWNLGTDSVGHKPNFKIYCPYCDETMVLRSSRLHRIMRGDGEVIPTNIIGYKCPNCALHRRFNIPMKQSDFDILLSRRGNNPLYYPPLSELTEDDRIAAQLSALGYYAGNYHDENLTIRED